MSSNKQLALSVGRTVTPVDEVRPDDHLLREAEDTEAATLERVVVHVSGVRHESRLFEQEHP